MTAKVYKGFMDEFKRFQMVVKNYAKAYSAFEEIQKALNQKYLIEVFTISAFSSFNFIVFI